MDNYYESCLALIQQHVKDDEIHDALRIIDHELSMPYVPEPYNSKFESLRDTLRYDRNPTQKYFEDVESIHEGLYGNDALKHKAIISLERMNLRELRSEIQTWFLDSNLEDVLKKQILLFLMDQDINEVFQLTVNGKTLRCNPAQCQNPAESHDFATCYQDLHTLLESENPSLLILCIAELEQRVFDAFPEPAYDLRAESVLNAVNAYLYKD